MRRKKQQRLKEEAFWARLLYFSVPRQPDEVPDHFERVNFRIAGVDDEELALMATRVRSINQLDLDGTDITIEGLRHLTRLAFIKELRLKECRFLDNEAVETICGIRSLELLHLGGTGITVSGLSGIGCLGQLKLLLISATEGEMNELPRLDAVLPPGCKLIVNHKDYNRQPRGERFGEAL